MRIVCDNQNAPEWKTARHGVITASEANKALMGRDTVGRTMYVQKLADDLEGIPDFDDEDAKPWFVAGRYYESFARGWYSWEKGFIIHDDYSFIGCSPDGLVGDDGLIEIKYRSFIRTFEEHIGKTTPVMPQVQTQMFVTGRKWCDYVNYWRDDENELEKGHIQRIERDDDYIDCKLLPAFISLWDDVQAELKRRGVS